MNGLMVFKYLHVVVSVESLETKGAGELCWTDENLSRGRDPILALVNSTGRILTSFFFVW